MLQHKSSQHKSYRAYWSKLLLLAALFAGGIFEFEIGWDGTV